MSAGQQRDRSEARTARPHTVRATETARCRRLPAPGRNSPETEMRERRRGGRRKPDTRSSAENAPQVREGRSTTGKEKATEPKKQKKKKKETKRVVFKMSQCQAMKSNGKPESQPQSIGNYEGRSKRGPREHTIKERSRTSWRTMRRGAGDEGRYGEALGRVAATPETRAQPASRKEQRVRKAPRHDRPTASAEGKFSRKHGAAGTTSKHPEAPSKRTAGHTPGPWATRSPEGYWGPTQETAEGPGFERRLGVSGGQHGRGQARQSSRSLANGQEDGTRAPSSTEQQGKRQGLPGRRRPHLLTCPLCTCPPRGWSLCP